MDCLERRCQTERGIFQAANMYNIPWFPPYTIRYKDPFFHRTKLFFLATCRTQESIFETTHQPDLFLEHVHSALLLCSVSFSSLMASSPGFGVFCSIFFSLRHEDDTTFLPPVIIHTLDLFTETARPHPTLSKTRHV